MTLSDEKQPSVDAAENLAEDFQISLLEEKLQVVRQRKKVGEVVIRKKVETRIVQVPIRREKLVIERIGQNPEILTEVVIGESKIGGHDELSDRNTNLTQSNFLNTATARELLEEIELLPANSNAKVRLTVITDDSLDRAKLQDICDRYSE